MLPDGTEMSGAELEQRLEKLMLFRKFLQIVERRGPSHEVVMALLDADAKDKTFFQDRERVEAIAAGADDGAADRDRAAGRRASGLRAGHRGPHAAATRGITGSTRTSSRPAEYRTLAQSYQDVKGIRGPMIVKTTSSAAADDAAAEAAAEAGVASADETAIGGAPLDDATRLAAEPKALADALIAEAAAGRQAAAAKPARDAEVRVESIDELVEFFTVAGKKGVAINRYKGLGEMNPDTLWETTMNPVTRTLAQVRAEDHMEADLMFTTLMGDQVEPRRKFIEDNALDVKNLDI